MPVDLPLEPGDIVRYMRSVGASDQTIARYLGISASQVREFLAEDQATTPAGGDSRRCDG